MILPRLALTNLSTRKVRTALTVAAIALAVSLVVSVTAGYKSVEAFGDRFLERYMGSTDAQVSGSAEAAIPQSLLTEIENDPAVLRASGRIELEADLLNSRGRSVPGHPPHLLGILRSEDSLVSNLNLTAGHWFNDADGPVAVIDQGVASRYGVAVGDELILPRLQRQLRLKIVGIVHKPEMLVAQMQSVYVPLKALQNFVSPGQEPQVSRILINLKHGANAEEFNSRWRDRLARLQPPLKLTTFTEARARLHENMRSLHVLSYMGGTISLLAATFIIFSALSMGVTERARTLAMLRAIGAYRSQLGWLVIIEGLLLALLGIATGVPLGWAWMKILSSIPRFAPFFASGVVMDWGGVTFATVAALLAALAASFLPAFSAMRLSPLEAMATVSAPTSRRLSVLCAVAGLLLIAVDPFLMYGGMEWTLRLIRVPEAQELARRIAFIGHFLLGLPCLMAGYFLLAPLFVIAVETVFGPPVALLMGLRYALLRQQLSSGIWRAAGTAAALMVGLATLVAMQTQGNSMLSAWKLPDKFPDIFIVDLNPTPFFGLTVADVPKIEQIEGIKKGEVMAIAIASPQLGNSLASVAMLGVVPDATMFFGVDPTKGNQMMELDFREGNSLDAWRQLKLGRHLLITNEFSRLRNLHVGDKFPLKTIHDTVDYTVAGVVWSPGLDVIKNVFDMGGQFDQRTAFSVFGTLDDAQRDFGIKRIAIFAANLQDTMDANHAVDKDEVLKRIRKTVGGLGLRAGDVRELKHKIQRGFYDVLLLVSTVAFAAMAIASLGVTNTIMASIRTRRWQFGVLRAIGVTRSQLLRLVLAEAVLLGGVGVSLGLVAGLEMAINAHRLTDLVSGYIPPISIPWPIILIGAGIVMLIALLASLWPALHVAKAQPLDLLQAGRAAT